jgi:hypothetical protein
MSTARIRRVPRTLTILAALVVLGAVAIGCSSSSTGTEDPTGGSGAAPATTVEAGQRAGELLAAVCAGTAEVSDGGTLTSTSATEISGIAASRSDPGGWWVNNDSGDSARVFAVSGSGTLLATVEVGGADAVDWEDIAADGDHLYVGDLGDNGRSRPGITVYRFAEPELDPSTTGAMARVEADTLTFTYPDGPHDAEALLVDPVGGDLVIVTKDWTLAGRSQVFRAPADLPAGSSTELEQVATVDLRAGSLVTAGDVSPDGSVVALRSYDSIWLYPRPDGQPVWAAFAEDPCDGPRPFEKQGEAIGFSADGASYATISEGETPTLHLTSP